MNTALVLFGSNVKPENSFQGVMQELALLDSVDVVAVSSVYESPLQDESGNFDHNRPRFHNAVVLVQTPTGAEELHKALRCIEKNLGRVRGSDKFADRSVDLDILAFQGNDGQGEVSRDIETQPFALIPAAEVAPDWMLSDPPTSVAELAAQFSKYNTVIRRIQ